MSFWWPRRPPPWLAAGAGLARSGSSRLFTVAAALAVAAALPWLLVLNGRDPAVWSGARPCCCTQADLVVGGLSLALAGYWAGKGIEGLQVKLRLSSA